MTPEHIGELASLATAVLWTLSAVAWTSAGRYVGALAVAFLRLVLAVGMFMAYGWFHRGLPWPSDAAPRVWQMLGNSPGGERLGLRPELCYYGAAMNPGLRPSLDDRLGLRPESKCPSSHDRQP